MIVGGAVLGGTLLAGRRVEARQADAEAPGRASSNPPGSLGGRTPVLTPNGASLPWKVVGGVKVFHLIAGPVRHEIAPGLTVEAWGYNGRVHGPTIEVVEGDRCRFYVTNKLAEPTSLHWHGVLLPNGMDGVGGLTQRYIRPGETFRYEFTFRYPGTHMYHPHVDEMTQIALGMTGMIVVHPRRQPRSRRRIRDYAIMLHEWKIPVGAARPDPLAMNDFNVLTMNGRSFPGTEPLLAETGDMLRIRLGNLSPMDHHPIHLHGHSFNVVATDGGPIPPSAQWPETTVLVPVGSTRTIEVVADAPGDWALHCHMTHHIMNQMGHEAANVIGADLAATERKARRLLPGYMSMGASGMSGMGEMDMPVPNNSIPMKGGRGPFDYIDMGGMFTIVKVRDRLPAGGDPGWYRHPGGTVASRATEAQLRADGIAVD
jgi:FtsP/CotA-like multicopper oxidase with cupredoxin domain